MLERHRIAAAALVSAVVVWAPVVVAAPPPALPSPEAGSAGDSAVFAEERMRAGDCAAALDAFDQAIRRTILPELRRDRGSCHEKLGHPFPAIDDYRAYLEARPDAPDADQVRARLEALESENGSAKPAPRSRGDAAGSFSVTSEASIGSKGGSASLDTIERNEELDSQADASPLRRGRGFALALHLDAAHFGSASFGWAEGAGLDLRYALSQVSTLLVGLQVMDVNAGGTASSLSGPGFIAGYEARIPFDRRLNDALLVGATFGYESLSQSSTGLAFGVIEPKGRLGYRHVFGPTFGLEAGLDCGPAWVHLSGAPAGVSATSSTSLLGGHVGLVLGF